MTNYTYLGWGTTDSNGVAKLDHDANDDPINHSYTGSGVGEVDVVASLDKPIVSGSVVSEPYNVWDTNFGDGGVTGNTNGGFYYTQDQTVVSRQTDNTGTTVTNLTSSLQTIRVNKPNTSIDEKDWVAPLNIEFDILSYTGIVYLQLWKSNNTYENVSVNLSNFLTGVSNPHMKVLVADGKMKVYVNDELKTDLVLTFGGLFGIRLLLSNNASFKYKNFFIYGMIKDYCVVTSQNNIVGAGDDLSITGQLYLNDELALNKTLDVYKDGSKVGTASTGDTGTATYTYTGVGDGEVEFQFKYSSIVSEPYNVIDATFYDKALDGSGNHNDNWGNPSTKVNINRSATGTTLTMDSGVTWGQLYAQSQSTYFDLPFAVELKSLDYSDTPTIRFANESSTSATHILTDGNWKISFNSDSITVLKDGESQTHYLNPLIGSTKLKVYLELSADTDMLKYKDFAIYPI